MYYFIHPRTLQTRSCEDPKHIARLEREGYIGVSHADYIKARRDNDRQSRERIAREDSHEPLH